MPMDTLPSAAVSDIDADAKHFANAPADFFGWSFTAMHSLPRERLDALQLAALRYRFEQLHDKIPVVKKLTEEQGLLEIRSVDDIIPALLPHSIYKSYPASLLENNKFAQITKWLGRLTTHDLSRIDVAHCQGIDEWLETMDAQSPLTILHTSGTTGKMSFLPRSKVEMDRYCDAVLVSVFQRYGDPAPTVTPPVWPAIDIVQASHKNGYGIALRMVAEMRRKLLKSDDQFHPLYQGTMSSDLLFLAGRMRAAAARGNQDPIEISPQLKARQQLFLQQQADMKKNLDQFYEHVKRDLRGKTILLNALQPMLYDMAKAGLERGERQLFATDSIVRTGGGAKGQDIPDHWQELCKEFLGAQHITNMYGMTEIMAQHHQCEHNRYHMEPTVVLFVIDPDTSAPLPRRGVQVGRGAFFDLMSDSTWGGFVSGDELSVDWRPCPCGRTTPHISTKVERYSAMRGGDDKISCAATPEAHESALSYLTQLA